jgi:hypothetical protein
MGGMEMDLNNILEPSRTSSPGHYLPQLSNWVNDKPHSAFNNKLPSHNSLHPPEYSFPISSHTSNGSIKYEEDRVNGISPLKKLTNSSLPSPIEIPLPKKLPQKSNLTVRTLPPTHPDRILRYPYEPPGVHPIPYPLMNGTHFAYMNPVHDSQTEEGSPYLITPYFSFITAPDDFIDEKSRSHSAGEVFLRQKSAKSLSPIHHYKYRHKAKMARYHRLSNKEDLARYELVIQKVLNGQDTRTTLMIKNIPNKYDQEMLLEAINLNFKGSYDFFYLPIDFKNKCNVGYAFINFINYLTVTKFYEEFNKKKMGKV